MSLLSRSPLAVLHGLAARVRAVRLARGWSQAELALRAGLPLPTYRVFERTGRISTPGLARVSAALGRLAELDGLFLARPESLDEVTRAVTRTRRRGKTL